MNGEKSRPRISGRVVLVVAAVLIGIVAAAVPNLLQRKSAHRAANAGLGPAVGMPGAPPTTTSGLQQRIDDMEKRLHDRPDDAAAAVLLSDALLRQARATNDSRPASRASEV